jgi:hypothetical protein
MSDTLIPPPPERPQLVEAAAQGRLGGPSYTYRGAMIDCQKDGQSFGSAGTITPLVDLWVDEGRLPRYMRAGPKAAAKR